MKLWVHKSCNTMASISSGRVRADFILFIILASILAIFLLSTCALHIVSSCSFAWTLGLCENSKGYLHLDWQSGNAYFITICIYYLLPFVAAREIEHQILLATEKKCLCIQMSFAQNPNGNMMINCII